MVVPFSVTVATQEVVPASQAPPELRLVLSNLDRMLPPVDIGVFFCYDNKKLTTSSSFERAVANLKRSMSDVLAPFYVFAGELVADNAGQLEIDCNNRGVEFTVAHANVELSDLQLHEPDKMIGKGLMPTKKAGILAVQVTELKCGSVVVSCAFDHRVADAYSANMFCVSWAETTSSKPITTVPYLSRSLVEPRNPLHPDPSIEEMYAPLSRLPSIESELSRPTTSRLYYIAAADVQRIQDLANLANLSLEMNGKNIGRRTKLEAFSAYIWKAIARCSDAKRSKLGIVVDGRSRMQVNCTEFQGSSSPSPMTAYFGNVFSIPWGTLHKTELREANLSRVAEEVHRIVQQGATEEHFRGLIDWLESHRPDIGICKAFIRGGDEEEDEVFVVSSGLRFPFANVDLGWGRPPLASYYFHLGSVHTYMMPILGPMENGDWVVYMVIDQGLLEALLVETEDVLHPITAEYLGLKA